MESVKQRAQHASAAPGKILTVEGDPTRLTDDEADWVLARLLYLLAPYANSGAFAQAFGVGAVFGVREDSRERAREWARMFVEVDR